MSPAEQLLDCQEEYYGYVKETREMVMKSYRDIESGKGRDCNEFFSDLEKRYLSAKV